MRREIGSSAIAELKSLVAQIVEAEKTRGREIRAVKIWNKIKAAPEITRYGYSSSYKNFNQGQYIAAKALLEAWREKGI